MRSRAHHPFRRTLALVVLLFLSPLFAAAQDGSIMIEVERSEDIGLEGHVRAGTWAPMKLTLRNNLPTIRKVNVDWISPDVDGDLVIARRENVVVNPNGTATVRLYAMPASNSKPLEGWTVRVVDAETDQVVAATNVRPRSVLHPRVGAIGITGTGLVGLGAFRDIYTQHEQIELLSAIDPSLLPDRWYGLRLLDALVWTPSTGRSPADPSVPLAAIKEWVRRGGHLVIILSALDAGWSDPKVADLLPPVTIGDAKTIDAPPRWLYESSDESMESTKPEAVQNVKFTVRPLTRRPDAAPGAVSMIVPGNVITVELEPTLVAAHQYGFGRVTLVGIDVTGRNMTAHAALTKYGLPRLWQTVFGWRSPGNLPAATLLDDKLMVAMQSREPSDLTSFIPGRIAMKTTAAATLFAAVVLFGVYWVVAGPGMFGALKVRKMVHHSWLVFGGIVIAFSAITWAAAFLLRPGMTEIEHFSIIDIDSSSTGPAQIRAQSYFSLFVPKHGTIDVAIDASKDRPNQNTLSSPGLPGSDRGSFVDERRYTINTLALASTPEVPVRSTAKQFEAQFCDIVDASPFGRRWGPPTGRLKLQNGWPQGELTHTLPGKLTNVRIIYCGGDGQPPEFGSYTKALDWTPGTPLNIGRPTLRMAMVAPPRKLLAAQLRKKTTNNPKPNGWEQRVLSEEGYLGELVNQIGGNTDPVDEDGRVKVVDPGAGGVVNRLELTTFFNMLPPPRFMTEESDGLSLHWNTTHLTRPVARTADLTHLTANRRVIILGHLETDSPIPVPLTVDGEEPDSHGWTMVRFVLPVE